jgi:uncharacterized protein YjlB
MSPTGRAASPRPADTVEVDTQRFASDGATPNNPSLPALILRGALPRDAGAGPVRTLLEANGWSGTWTYTVFPYHHYHDDAHEVLAVTRGWADIVLGGEKGRTVRVEVGDVLVLPAGTGHCRVADGGGFEVCGAYPPGQESPNILRPAAADHDAAARRIAGLSPPDTDPVYGADGPLLAAWRAAGD